MAKVNYKAVVTDLDGTLLPSKRPLSKQAIEYLIALQQKGILLILATGRTPQEIETITKQLQLELYSGYLICCNGQTIVNLQKQQRWQDHKILKADALKLVQLGQQFQVVINIDNGEIMAQSLNFFGFWYLFKRLLKKLKNTSWVYQQLKGRPIRFYYDIRKAVDQDLRKISFSGSPKELNALKAAVEEQFPERFSCMFVTETWLEIMEKNVSKGTALKKLASQLGLQCSEIIAFGDGENDISLLKAAGWGVAMINAMPAVLSAADAVSDLSNEEDGVIAYLNKIGL